MEFPRTFLEWLGLVVALTIGNMIGEWVYVELLRS